LALRALQADRALRVSVPDPACGRIAGVVGDRAIPVLPGRGGLGHVDRAVPGAVGDPRDPADQRFRIRRSVVAQEVDSAFRFAEARSAGRTTVRVDPSRVLQRTARHGHRDTGFTGAARLRQLRSAGDRQQHQERGRVETGRATLRGTRRALPPTWYAKTGWGVLPATSTTATSRWCSVRRRTATT